MAALLQTHIKSSHCQMVHLLYQAGGGGFRVIQYMQWDDVFTGSVPVHNPSMRSVLQPYRWLTAPNQVGNDHLSKLKTKVWRPTGFWLCDDEIRRTTCASLAASLYAFLIVYIAQVPQRTEFGECLWSPSPKRRQAAACGCFCTWWTQSQAFLQAPEHRTVDNK